MARRALPFLLIAIFAASAQAALPKGVRLGTTFSHKELGADWPAALDAMGPLGLQVLRLGAYWSSIERSEGKFDFSELDALLSAVQSKGRYEVLLTVGMKAPRWPEYYIPGWAAPKTNAEKNGEVSKDPELRERALRFVRETVRHCAKYGVIAAWQVENEPMDPSGPNNWFIGADFLKEEAQAARESDPARRSRVINIWTDPSRSYPEANVMELADVVGVDVYPRPGHPLSPEDERAVRGTLPSRYLQEATGKGKPAWVIESQAEPWGSMTADPEFIAGLAEAEAKQGYKTILLWGYEWWYRQKKSGDASVWKAIRGLSTERR